MVCQRISEDDASEFFCDLVLCFASELCHVAQIDPCFLADGEGQCLHCGIHAGDRLRASYGAFGENICLPVKLSFLIKDFQGSQEAVAGILGKGPAISVAADDPVLGSEFIVAAVQASLDRGNFCITLVVQLCLQQFLNSVAQLDHAEHALCRCRRKLHAVHTGVLPIVDMPIDVGVAEVFYGRVCRDGEIFILQFGIRYFRYGDLAMDMAHGFLKLFREGSAFDGLHRDFLPAVLGTFSRQFSQDHFRMVLKVAVDRISLFGFRQVHPVGFFHGHAVPFLKEEDVRHNTSVCIAHKGIVGQADGTEQISPVSKILPYRFVLLVHGAAGGDDSHYAAGTDQVEGFCNEIIMDQEIVPVISGIDDFVLAEGHVTDHGIKKAVREGGRLESLNSDVVFLI